MRLLRHSVLTVVAATAITMAGYSGGAGALISALIAGNTCVALGYFTRVNYEHYREPPFSSRGTQ